MEQGEVKDFSDIFAINRIRHADAQNYVPNSQTSSSVTTNSFKRSTKITKSMPCVYFNQGSCMQAKSHETRGVLYEHICASCFANNGRTFLHAEVDCKNKNKQPSKNKDIYNANVQRNEVEKQFASLRPTWTLWWAQPNFLHKQVDHRSYATVLKVFPGIFHHIFLPTAVLIVPGAVKVVVIS